MSSYKQVISTIKIKAKQLTDFFESPVFQELEFMKLLALFLNL